MDIIKDLLVAMDKGVDFTCNSSPTCRAKVVNVMNGITVLKVVKHPEPYMKEYNEKAKNEIGKCFTLPSQWAWNAIYF